MRILIATTAGVGHLRPLLPFGAACADAGHEIALATPRSFLEQAAATGFPLFPFDDVAAADRDSLRRTVEDQQFGVRYFAELAPRAALPGLLAATEQFRPDLVFRDAAELGSAVAAEAWGVPDVAMFFSVHRRMRVTTAAAMSLLGPLRAVAGVPRTRHRTLEAMRAVSLFPESFDPAEGPPQPMRFRVGGEPRRVARDRSLVYVSFGTVTPGRAEGAGVLRQTVAALAGLPIDLVVSSGSSDPAMWHDPEPNVDVRTWVNEQELLPEAAAVVCHGGAGTTLASLRAGVPLVIVPQFGDQPAIADAVQASGAGLGLGGRPDPAEIRKAVERVVGEPAFRIRAKTFMDDIAALPDMSRAVRFFEDVATSIPR